MRGLYFCQRCPKILQGFGFILLFVARFDATWRWRHVSSESGRTLCKNTREEREAIRKEFGQQILKTGAVLATLMWSQSPTARPAAKLLPSCCQALTFITVMCPRRKYLSLARVSFSRPACNFTLADTELCI